MASRLVLVFALVACRDSTSSTPDAGALDAGLGTTCDGECAETSVRAEFQAVRVFDHAVFGINSDATLHVEAYLGGDAGCPIETSPAPDYTLVLGKVAEPNGTAPTTSTGNVLDFVGDLLGGALGAQANTVIVRAVAASPNEFVALDVDLEFANGGVIGHLYAIHCDSLDSP
jgi:hypothetical protein